jgi:hypothetical protein
MTFTSPLSTRPIIKKKDVANGYIERYFVKFISNDHIIEVNQDQYNVFFKNPYYYAIKLDWSITGTIEDTTIDGKVIRGTRFRNTAVVDYYDKLLPGLRHTLADPLEYFITTV